MFRMFVSSSALVVLLLGHFAHASITIVDSGKILDSKPEKHLGTRLWKGYEYIGRLQYVPNNLQLCKGEGGSFTISAPEDGLTGKYEMKQEERYTTTGNVLFVIYRRMDDLLMSIFSCLFPGFFFLHSGTDCQNGWMQFGRKGLGGIDYDSTCQHCGILDCG
jgi:hypothetical protein